MIFLCFLLCGIMFSDLIFFAFISLSNMKHIEIFVQSLGLLQSRVPLDIKLQSISLQISLTYFQLVAFIPQLKLYCYSWNHFLILSFPKVYINDVQSALIIICCVNRQVRRVHWESSVCIDMYLFYKQVGSSYKVNSYYIFFLN